MKISIVIPTKNEERSIKEIIEQCNPYGDEILVVDGHSRDLTRDIAQEAGARVVLDNRGGKGDGLRVGLKEAKGDIIVFIDADGSHDANDIPEIIQPIIEGKADLVVGSRMRGGSDELHGDIGKFIRIIGSDIITLTINYRFGVRLTDSQNGFRAIRKDVGLKIGLKEDIFTIEQEMIMKTLKHGYKIMEIPAHEYSRKYGDSNIVVWKVAHRYVWCLIKNLF
ncbi:MAG TPA: glycosyltransferase family 2 protein [Nitrospirae bacterium]|nr:undecaprenyl-phosphate mannosyltransferase [bacterium BMS3Abin06]HDH11032.1 glycosyltransferase family 2 protein [Nitrospirota bacterium]HDZ01316.1 glycosyltransferase family 2 protein [Nitrospirota bacterium]